VYIYLHTHACVADIQRKTSDVEGKEGTKVTLRDRKREENPIQQTSRTPTHVCITETNIDIDTDTDTDIDIETDTDTGIDTDADADTDTATATATAIATATDTCVDTGVYIYIYTRMHILLTFEGRRVTLKEKKGER